MNIITDIIDITNWARDEIHDGIFPRGSREKESFFSPKQLDKNYLKPNHRYLFKQSRNVFPWQFWNEIIAYNIGNLMKVTVPPTYIGFDSKRGIYAALVEWFYDDKEHIHQHGGDILKNRIENYDTKRGKQHNLESILLIFPESITRQHWIKHWIKILTFDSFIGNTDRHHDNWGIVLSKEKYVSNNHQIMFFSPAFDNGTSMGHEILEDNLDAFPDDKITNYLAKGTHHMKWALSDSQRTNHFDFIQKLLYSYPQHKNIVEGCLNFDFSEIETMLQSLSFMNTPVTLSNKRIEFMLKLFKRRYDLLQGLLVKK